MFHNNNFLIHCMRGDILTGLQLAFKVSVIPLNQVNKKLKNVHPVRLEILARVLERGFIISTFQVFESRTEKKCFESLFCFSSSSSSKVT